MGKTKEQVNRYLTHCRFSDEDWARVLVYCRRNGLGYAHKSSRPKSSSTYDQFVEWFRCGYGSGDVVKYGGTVGILSTSTPEYSELCAYYSLDGRLIVDSLQIEAGRIEGLAGEWSLKIYDELRKCGYDFDARLARVYERTFPDVGSMVRYECPGRVGNGLVGGYHDGYVTFTFSVEEGRVTMDFSVPLRDVKFSPISTRGIKEVNDSLASSGFRWNQDVGRLEVLRPRSENGGLYWYVSDKVAVSVAKDTRSPLDNARYQNGNYFTQRLNAVSFLSVIRGLRESDFGGLV